MLNAGLLLPTDYYGTTFTKEMREITLNLCISGE